MFCQSAYQQKLQIEIEFLFIVSSSRRCAAAVDNDCTTQNVFRHDIDFGSVDASHALSLKIQI